MDKTKAAVAVFDKLAALYQQKYIDVSAYSDSFRVFCENLPDGASIFELACGPGNITRYLLDLRPDLKIYATDLSPNMVALAAQNNPEARFGVLDCREISNLNEAYDAVMCGFCLPYLSKEDAVALIADAARLLRADGLLYISTMEDDYQKSGFEAGSTGDKIFMHYHEAGYLTSAFKESGLAVIFEKRYHSFLGEKRITDLVLVGQK
ncbi:MAG: class I SAM-dependent methyltransferase [Flavobacterium sp.]|nr:MAG: class I SAM-dependent methyltransferase [Flavobacterium sp.]